MSFVSWVGSAGAGIALFAIFVFVIIKLYLQAFPDGPPEFKKKTSGDERRALIKELEEQREIKRLKQELKDELK